jgi:hypothetical protein
MQVMRKAFGATTAIIVLVGFGLFSAARAQTQDAPPADDASPGFVAETKRFAFFSHYWLNMHHFLHQVALARNEGRSSPADAKVKNRLSAPEKNLFDEAIAFYKRNLINKDLRSSEYMQDFKSWVVRQDTSDFSSVPQEFRDHTERLESFDSLYREHFWDKHRASNESVVSDNLNLVRATEDSVAERLSSLTHESWPRYKLRVDVTYYGKSQDNTAFTTIFPAHIVAPSKDQGTVEGSWVEVLYHEAGHQLVRSRTGFVPGTIRDVSEVEGQGLRNLWHAYLFYFAGAVTRNALKREGIENYKMNMVREEIFSLYVPSFQKYLPRYLNRKATLAEVTRSIIEDVYERGDLGQSK